MKQFFKKCYLAIILIFLYIPIVVLICQSFNAGKSRAKWEGFSFHWYEQLFSNSSIMSALWVTVSIAVIATIVATILGTLAAIGIYSMKKRPQAVMMTITNLPNTMPDIVTGISLMLLFIFAKVDRGYVTMDLGATPGYALWHVLIPECKQGIVTGALLAFTLSLDDFTISYFTTSPLVQNLSTLIYSATKLGISPVYYALSSLMFVVLLVLLMIVNHRTADNN